MKAVLKFHSGVGRVTGSNFELEAEGKKYLIDCGLVQGSRFCDDCNYAPFPYDPKQITKLLATHAHIDHIGRIPRLVKEGYQGEIISTPQTKELAHILLRDSVKILAEEAKRADKEPLYENADVDQALSQWRTEPYHKEFNCEPFAVTFKDAGHILGSAMVSFTHGTTTFIATGDLGNSPAPLLPDTETIQGTQYLLTESVYGDRNHEERDLRREKLKQAVLDIKKRGGTLLIPAFSVERTQVLLYELNNFFEDNEVPQVPVYLDSPLAIAATEIYGNNSELFKESVQKEIQDGDDIFSFPGFTFVDSAKESKALDNAPNPKIIIAGSGMSMGGRIVRHEKNLLEDKNSILLLVGYQGIGTLGRRIAEGEKRIKIMGETVSVKAEIRKVSGYSAHKDGDNLLEFIGTAKDTLKEVFVAMGEPAASQFLAQRIHDFLDVSAVVPTEGEHAELNFS